MEEEKKEHITRFLFTDCNEKQQISHHHWKDALYVKDFFFLNSSCILNFKGESRDVGAPA